MDGECHHMNDAGVLTELLLQQAARSEELEVERWELLQQLREKDEQLAYEENAVEKQRKVLSTARGVARHYRAVCALRAWHDYVQQVSSERALLRARHKLSANRVRHGCSLLRVVLKHAVDRQLSAAFEAMWAAGNTMPELSTVLQEESTSNHDLEGFLTPLKEHKRSFLLCPITPLRDKESTSHGFSKRRRHLTQSVSSEASTAFTSTLIESTSSSSRASFETTSAGTVSSLAAVRLSLALEGACIRRQFHCFSRLHLAMQASKQNENAKFSESRRKLHSCEAKCTELEALSIKQAEWREDAETRIRVMVSFGEGLELERLRLRRELAETRRNEEAHREQLCELRASLEQEEQLGELLRARVWALEQDTVDLASEAQREKVISDQDAAHAEEQLAAAASERATLLLELQEAQAAKEAAELRAATKARRNLLEAWGRDRGHWAEVRAELGARIAWAENEARSARERCAQVEAELASKARWEAAEMREIGRAEIRSEEQMCSSLAAQLRESIEKAEALEAARPEEEFGATVQLFLSGHSPQAPSTPQLQELDALGELVERLRNELAAERTQREASSSTLAALRTSYRLLLQRSAGAPRSPGSISRSTEASVTSGSRAAMPMAWAVH